MCYLQILIFILLLIDLQYADCMRNLLQVVELGDIKLLVEKAQQRATASTSTVDTDNRGENAKYSTTVCIESHMNTIKSVLL